MASISTCALILHHCTNVPKMGVFCHSDTFAQIFFPPGASDPMHTTAVVKDSDKPAWEETIQLRFGGTVTDTSARVVFRHCGIFSDSYIGEALIPIAEPAEKQEALVWDKVEKQQNTGTVATYTSQINLDKYRRNTIGMLTMNPQWVGGQPGIHSGTTLLNAENALPIMSNMQQFKQYFASMSGANYEMSGAIRDDPAAMALLQSLSAVFARYEVPMGLVTKLMTLSTFDAIEFIIDDSGSMALQSDLRDPITNVKLTRWGEVRMRIKIMLEVIAYVRVPPITIYFLNCPVMLELEQEEDEVGFPFLQRIHGVIDAHWKTFGPTGTTPAQQRIAESFERHRGKSCMRYFFGDGVPDDSKLAVRHIMDLLIHRPTPDRSPFTFFSCTNNRKDTEWMKEVEEVAPYVAEFDDFKDEAMEVLGDQGEGLPYSMGVYLIASIVGVMYPDDLDCIDESVPFSKFTLESIVGYSIPLPHYEHYFKYFIRAQQKSKTFASALDVIKRNQVPVWGELFPNFLEVRKASDILQVQDYRTQLLDTIKMEIRKKN